MIIGIIDCETSGLSPKTDHIIELAIKLYCTVTKTSVAAFSMLLPGDGTNPCEQHNNIPPAALKLPVVSNLEFTIGTFVHFVHSADILIAHNASFDRGFIDLFFERYGINLNKTWHCSLRDLTFPKEGSSKKLTYLALDHGIYIGGAHRALIDTHILEELIKLVPDVIDQLTTPKINYVALVEYEEKDDAKAVGFQWDKLERVWRATLTEKAAGDLMTKVKFKIVTFDSLKRKEAGKPAELPSPPAENPTGK